MSLRLRTSPVIRRHFRGVLRSREVSAPTGPSSTTHSEAAPRRPLRFDPRGPTMAVAYIVFYIALDGLSYIQPVLKLGITPWNPQAGLTLAFLLVRGPRWAPATAVAALLSEVLVRGAPAAWPVLVGASAEIACAYALLSMLLRRWGMPRAIETTADAIRLAAAAAVTTLAVAAGYVLLFVAAGGLSVTAAAGSVARYWVGDLNGVLTLTPLLLGLRRWRELSGALRKHGSLIATQFAAVVLTLGIIFGLPATDQLRLFYPLFVPMIWITLRWGVPGAVLSTLMIQIGLVIVVQDEPGAPALIDLQFLLLTLSLTALLLGTVVTERWDALRRVAQRETEQRVLLATAPDAVLTIDSGGLIRSANPAALRLFGPLVNERIGRPVRAVLPGIKLNPLDTTEGRATLEGRTADGSTFPAEIAWARLEAPAESDYVMIVRDVSQRQRAETQLREHEAALARAMRFAVAGELASALAHELNQPITALVSYLQAAELLAAPLLLQDGRLQSTLGKATHADRGSGDGTRRGESRAALCNVAANSGATLRVLGVGG